MSNHLKDQSSPYLLQHAENPVDWYPWGKEAFEKAKNEDKPVFLSIGYSTCHWCHVMAHESFEDDEIAAILNKNFVSIKVDKEERPDIDSIYMAVCQALTGNGGWPTSMFMTPDQKPFYAGTYYPKKRGYGTVGFETLLLTISEKWQNERELILRSADEITVSVARNDTNLKKADSDIFEDAVMLYKKSFDEKNGGFGHAPKFPTPHNLIFLLKQYQKFGDKELLEIAEKTLTQMYRGGMFDHIGYGFSRYSTDRFFLVPHFEKMLYDNALLISAYCVAYDITKNVFFKNVAEKTAFFILTEMTNEEGAFLSAQDADSEGVEGKYYVFEPDEITRLLGEKDGKAFNEYFDITSKGNFEGKNIPNLLKTSSFTDRFDEFLPKIRAYRKERTKLHTDDKILTVWNSLMIAALCSLYRISGKEEYLDAAKRALNFINKELYIDNTLFVSFRDGKRGEKGFLDDYATFAYALLSLYGATLQTDYLNKAKDIVNKTINDFFDNENGGFFLYGKENEALIFRPKETYDGAIPSGNSIMAYNLVQLHYVLPDENLETVLDKQFDALYGDAHMYPSGYAMFLISFSDYNNPYEEITAVIKNNDDIKELPLKTSLGSFIRVLEEPTDEYKLLNDKTTYYICKNRSCFPPVNEINLKKGL